MSLLDKASLIVTPNGFKASKLYSVIPSTGAGDMDVTRATTATRVNSTGLIESVATNVPRIDYLNSSCPSILVEPQRTNVQTYSEDFSNAIYLQIGTTVTTNAIVAPNGTTTADKIVEDTSTGFHTIDILNPPVVAGSYTVSVFVKAAERTKFQILGFFALTGNVNFDLIAGTATTTAPALNGRIENYGNGWYRCQATFTDLTGVGSQILFNILNNAGSNSYTGTAGSGLYLWGAQLELGSYSTSYIPTTSASVTRNTDVISKTGITSLIGQTEGTIFLDVKAQLNSADEQDFSISDGTTNNRAFIRLASSGVIRAIGVFAGNTEFNIGSTAYTTGTRYKIALAYKNNDVILYINGTSAASTSTTTISGTLSRLGFDVFTNGAQTIVSPVNSAILFKTRLSNSELAQLTTI
jgi:hypothetical protein